MPKLTRKTAAFIGFALGFGLAGIMDSQKSYSPDYRQPSPQTQPVSRHSAAPSTQYSDSQKRLIDAAKRYCSERDYLQTEKSPQTRDWSKIFPEQVPFSN
jgi:hypothetical protein